jgi:PIN domain nuclease of toxin-antitoxin system
MQKKVQDPIWAEQYRLREKERKRRWVQEQNEDKASWEQYLDNRIRFKEEALQRPKKDPVKLDRFQARDRNTWR